MAESKKEKPKYNFTELTKIDHDKDNYENVTTDTRCGVGNLRPKWIQKFASKKVYSLALSIFSLAIYGQISSYQGTMSTLEKNFGLSAKMMGSLKSVSEAASGVGNFFAYAADRGNKIAWISSSSFIFFLGCICFTLPIFSSTSLQNINAYRESSNISQNIMRYNVKNSCNNDANKFSLFTNLIILPIIISQCLMGFSNAIQRTCGLAYMDNNIRKNVFPIWHAGIYSTQWLGYGLGLILTSFALQAYVFPTLTVNINNSDPRWIGSWWIPFLVFGGIGLLLTPIFLLFPKSLPRAAIRDQNKNKTPIKNISMSDFYKSLKSILSNKVLMCETVSSAMFTLGFNATSWPKYIEIQYGMTASKSSLMQGFAEFTSRPFGIFTLSILIMKFKPRSKTLLRVNLAITVLCFIICVLLGFMGCEQRQLIHGHMNTTTNIWDLTEECNAAFECSNNLKFAPVCNKLQIFFSSCHAGCESTTFLKHNKTLFTNCHCMKDSADFLEEGLCQPDCTSRFTIYILLIALIKTLKAGAKSIKVLVELRSMEDGEKSFSIGIIRTIVSLFSTIPAIILYGSILDASCVVWDYKCGIKGNCWLYDSGKLKSTFFVTSSVFMGISVVMDFLLCIYVKSLKIYDEDFIEEISIDQSNGKPGEQKLLTKNFIQ